MVSLFRSLYEFPKPTIAAVNGGRCGRHGLALLCDFTLAVPKPSSATRGADRIVPAIVSTFLLRQLARRLPAIFCSRDASSTRRKR